MEKQPAAGTRPAQTQKASFPNIEESIQNSPTIRTISKGLVDISSALVEIDKKTSQAVEQKVAQTEQKVTNLAQAVSLLNEEFTKFINAFKASPNPPSGSPNQPSGNPSPASNSSSADIVPSSNAQDKLMYWGSLLARLAELGKPPASAPQPSSNTEEGLVKGFDLMMGVVTKLMQVQSSLRKNFLDELKDTFTIFPKALNQGKEKAENQHLSGNE